MKLTTNELRHRIVFQRASEAVDEFGQTKRTWTEVRSVPAKMVVKNTREQMTSDRLQPAYVYEFTIRAVPDLRTTDRILYQGQFYTVESVVDKEGLRKLLIIQSQLMPFSQVNTI